MNKNYDVRTQADYSPKAVTGVEAVRASRRAEQFVEAIVRGEQRP